MAAIFPVITPSPAAPHRRSQRTPSTEFIALSKRLALLQSRLADQFGITTLYIGAGSALAVLDHVLHGKPLVMRDLDIFACLNGNMTREKAFQMGAALECERLGHFSQKDVRPRRRGNPNLPLPAAFDYNSGFGLFLIDGQQQILDLTIFHQLEDMMLNGIMNVDRVRIRLDYQTSLIDQFRSLCNVSRLSSDEQDGLAHLGVEDDFDGYLSWRNDTALLVNDFDIRRAPLQTIIRIIRTFGKFSSPRISQQTKLQLRRLLESEQEDNSAFYTIRGLIKLLGDRNAVWGLKLLRELGGLNKVGVSVRQHLEPLLLCLDAPVHAGELRQMCLRIVQELSDRELEMKLEGVH